MYLKTSSAKWPLFCPGGDNLLVPGKCGCNVDYMILKHISVRDQWLISGLFSVELPSSECHRTLLITNQHCWHQTITWTDVDLSLVWYCGIHLRLQMNKWRYLINKTVLKRHPHLPGTKESKIVFLKWAKKNFVLESVLRNWYDWKKCGDKTIHLGLKPKEYTSLKFWWKYKENCIWKCHLQNGSLSVLASVY